MNKLPLSTAALSVLVAVGLWYLATLLESDAPWLEPRQDAGQATPEFGRQVEESPVFGGAAALRCQESEHEIQALVAESRYCESDDDCTIFDYGYPIQCLTSVAKSEITRLRLQYREYEADCEFRVYYDCPAEPMERKPVCRDNRCEVVLETHDLLRDETLEYLGIDDAQ